MIEHIKSSIVRLGGAIAAGSDYAQKRALQDIRTYHVARAAGLSGWATFRLQLSAAGVAASQEISGDAKVAVISEKINEMKFLD